MSEGKQSRLSLAQKAARLRHNVLRSAQPRCYAAWTSTGARSVLQQIAEMTVKIKQYDRQIQQLGQTSIR